MIKVINKKKEEPKTYKSICDKCGAELEYEESDTYIGVYGDRELICPSCHESVFVDEVMGICLNSRNIEFPLHFMPPNDSAVDIDDSKIQEWVRECLKRAESDHECNFYMTESGNTVVIVLKFVDEYTVYVSKKYYDCSIPRE